MSEESVVTELPQNVTRSCHAGREIYIVGTAHVSRGSVQDVAQAIETLRPDTVCVELCEPRYRAIVHQDAWRSMDIFKVIRQKRAVFLLAQLVLTVFYRRLGQHLGVQPGAEMIEAIRQAEQHSARLVLADRPIETTLRRVWGNLNLWNRFKMVAQIAGGMFVSDSVDETLVEEMKNQDQLEHILSAFTKSFPEVKKRLIDERDLYLAYHIQNAPGERIVAVVGAGHVPGICRVLGQAPDPQPLLTVPPRSRWGRVLGWVLPAVVLLLLALGFMRGGAGTGMESICIWVLVNGVFAAAAAALALPHPLTVLTAFVGAPLTSLNPMVAAGWVAGLAQAWLRKPTVADLEDLPADILTVRGFWRNPVSKILLVVVLANLGSTLGTFLSGAMIAARVFE